MEIAGLANAQHDLRDNQPAAISLDGVPSNLGLDSLAHRSEISCRQCAKNVISCFRPAMSCVLWDCHQTTGFEILWIGRLARLTICNADAKIT